MAFRMKLNFSWRGDEKGVCCVFHIVCSMLWSARTIDNSNCVMGADFKKVVLWEQFLFENELFQSFSSFDLFYHRNDLGESAIPNSEKERETKTSLNCWRT